MLKAVGSLLLLFGCLSIGMVNVKQMDKRIKTLQSLLCAMEVMEREMSFSVPLLEDIMIISSQSTESAVRSFLSMCSYELKKGSDDPFCAIWNRAAREHLTALKENDLEHVLALGNVLGRYDSEGQRQAILRTHAVIKQMLSNAQADRNSRSKVYKTVSATAGVFLVILLL